MKTKVTERVMDLVKWTDRQNLNLGLYIEWWLTHPNDRARAPFAVEFDPVSGIGRITRSKVTVGEFRMVDENDYVLDWIRSVRDSELMGAFGLEGLDGG